MSTRVGAPTKGLVKNNKTGEIDTFQFNPSGFTYSRSITYASIESPGMSYPDTQFVKGNAREFNVTLMFFDKPYTGRYIKMCTFYGALLTPEYNTSEYIKPPEFTFVFGVWVRTCVLTGLDINVIETDKNLNPTRFEFTLTIRQVGVIGV